MNTKTYSLVHGIYYVSVNAVFGFVAFFLFARGVSNSAIGMLISVTSIINLILQPILGNAVDRSQRLQHHHVISILAALSFVSGLFAFFFLDARWCLMLFLACAMIMTQLNMPIINSLSSVWISKGHHINFGVARGVGSVCYAIASFVIGYLSDVDHLGSQFIPVSICITSALLLIVMIALTPSLSKLSANTSKNIKTQTEKAGGLWNFASRYWNFMIFIVGSILVSIGHNIITNFSISVLAPIGGGGKEVGIISGIAAVCELPTMFFFSKINRRISISKLITIGGVFFTLKLLFCLIAFLYGSMKMMFAAQALQMFGFALFIPASVLFTNAVINDRDITLAQSFVTASNTAGGIIGSLLGGSLLDLLGVGNMMICTVILSAIGSFIIIASVWMLDCRGKEAQGEIV